LFYEFFVFLLQSKHFLQIFVTTKKIVMDENKNEEKIKNENKRAKLYYLDDDSQWIDKGTGFVEYVENQNVFYFQ
jgi:hypothetical protein